MPDAIAEGDAVVEDESVINLRRQPREYYDKFTDNVRVGTLRAVELFGQCFVRINGEDVEAVVLSIFADCVGADYSIIWCYMLYGKGSKVDEVCFLGYFSSGRVSPRFGGWDLPDNSIIDATADDKRFSGNDTVEDSSAEPAAGAMCAA